jgi:endo-1,4-beta-xylanase
VPVATAGRPGFGSKFVGNITTGMNGIDSGSLKYATYWNQITPENAGKWGSVQKDAGSALSWAALDTIYNYTKTNNIIFKQHTFMWGAQQPSGSIDEAAVKNWMTEFCKRYPDVKVIDVVNEPPPHTTPSYANAIGGGTNGTWAWIANAFKWARAACPNAILVLNDYNDIEWTNDNSHMIDIVKKIKALDAPIDAIGAQAHDLDNASVSFNTVKSLLAKLNSETGLPIYITEMDLSYTDDAQQLKAYQQFFPLFMEAEYVKGITIWGWIYGSTWSQAPNSGLVKSGKSRSAMTWLMDQLGRPAP